MKEKYSPRSYYSFEALGLLLLVIRRTKKTSTYFSYEALGLLLLVIRQTNKQTKRITFKLKTPTPSPHSALQCVVWRTIKFWSIPKIIFPQMKTKKDNSSGPPRFNIKKIGVWIPQKTRNDNGLNDIEGLPYIIIQGYLGSISYGHPKKKFSQKRQFQKLTLVILMAYLT